MLAYLRCINVSPKARFIRWQERRARELMLLRRCAEFFLGSVPSHGQLGGEMMLSIRRDYSVSNGDQNFGRRAFDDGRREGKALDRGRTVWSHNSIGESRVNNDSNPPGEFRWRVFYFSVFARHGNPAERYRSRPRRAEPRGRPRFIAERMAGA
jgi:hypothetical protein